MWGKYFYYDGHTSDEFGLMMGSISPDTSIPLAMNRDIIRGDLNRVRYKVNHMGTKWSDVLSFQISMVRDVCNSGLNPVFTEDEVDEICSWLTSPDYPLLFHMYDYNEIVSSENSMLVITMTNGSNTFVVSGENTLTINANGYSNTVITFNTKTGEISTQYQSINIDPETGRQIEPYIEYVDPETGESSIIPNDNYSEELSPEITNISLELSDGYMSLVFGQDSNDWLKNITSVRVNIHDLIKTKINNSWIVDCIQNNQKDNDPGQYGILINQRPELINGKYDYFGLFSDITTQELDGDVIGFEATFTTNSPFAWGPLRTETFTIDENNQQISIDVNSSERYRELYPVVKINNTSYGTPQMVTITAVTDQNRELQIKSRAMVTTIDCEKCRIYDETTSTIINFEELGLEDVSYIYWPRLRHGTNVFNIDKNVKIVFQFREPRKVGAY